MDCLRNRRKSRKSKHIGLEVMTEVTTTHQERISNRTIANSSKVMRKTQTTNPQMTVQEGVSVLPTEEPRVKRSTITILRSKK
jgi:hypothetical protein